MKIHEIRLKNFKRFTDTTITGISETVRLVVLAGPNGCGKSSLIDAAHMWYRNRWGIRLRPDETYNRKQVDGAIQDWDANKAVNVRFHDPQPATDEQRLKALYVRTAYRNDPELELGNLSSVGAAVFEDRINRLIDNDQAVSQNYRRLVSQGFQEVYESADPALTLGVFRDRSIGEIRDCISRLFPGLVLNSLGNPLSAGTFQFDKGESKGFLYKNLSGGEKAAFDLILDIYIKKKEFDDAVFFIDEPEAHMGAALQGALLGELYEAIPLRGQLWIATHSIGMMRKARELAQAQPGTVAFLDFDGLNFDLTTTVKPTEPSRSFWKRAIQIALDDLAGYVAPEHVVLCEGSRLSGGRDFDAECYSEIFHADYPQVLFIGAGNADDIQNDPRGVSRLLSALTPDVRITRLIDRDDRTDAEVATLRQQGVRVLTRRHIESYLLDDQILANVVTAFESPEKVPELLNAKAAAIASSVAAGGPIDDMKRPAGEIYNAAKRLLPGNRLGSDNRAFMKGICAPQVRMAGDVYQALRRDIFDE